MSRYEIQIQNSTFLFQNEHDAKAAFEIVKFLKASGTLIETTGPVGWHCQAVEHECLYPDCPCGYPATQYIPDPAEEAMNAKKTLNDYDVPSHMQKLWNTNDFKHEVIYIKLIDGKFVSWTSDHAWYNDCFVPQTKEDPHISTIIYDVDTKEITT